jgi:hypothetical protein
MDREPRYIRPLSLAMESRPVQGLRDSAEPSGKECADDIGAHRSLNSWLLRHATRLGLA